MAHILVVDDDVVLEDVGDVKQPVFVIDCDPAPSVTVNVAVWVLAPDVGLKAKLYTQVEPTAREAVQVVELILNCEEPPTNPADMMLSPPLPVFARVAVCCGDRLPNCTVPNDNCVGVSVD